MAQFYFYSCYGLTVFLYLMKAQFLIWFSIVMSSFIISQISKKIKKGNVLIILYNFFVLLLIKYDDSNGHQLKKTIYLFLNYNQFQEPMVTFYQLLNFQTLFMISYGVDQFNQNQIQQSLFEEIVQYLSYLTYQPLYLCGPIISYESFIKQAITNQNNNSIKQNFIYFFKTISYFVLLQIMIHLMYPYALLGKPFHQIFWDQEGFFWWLSMCHMTLFFLYLKFMIIWRTMRVWALFDGIETHENMQHCIMATYSFQLFWRNWHGSFNKWLLKYLYFPLGGNKRRILNLVIIFLFVAIWHDFNKTLLIWAIFVIITMSLEIWIKNYYLSKNQYHHRYIEAFAAAVSLHLQMLANLVGFIFGMRGFEYIFSIQALLFQIIFIILLSFMIVLTFQNQSNNEIKGYSNVEN